MKHNIQGPTLTLERVFNAPQELVFSMWTATEKLKQWWLPGEGWTLAHSEMDFREGGKWHYMMKGPDDGSEYANMESWGIMTYLEIDPPDKIVCEDSFTDVSGEINKEMPTSKTTIEFSTQGNATRVISTTTFGSEQELQQSVEMGMLEGVAATYDYLEIALEKELSK